MMREEELRATYRLGEDETVALITNLFTNHKALTERIQRLVYQIAKNSGNSIKERMLRI